MIIDIILNAFSSFYLLKDINTYKKMGDLRTAVLSAIAVSVVSSLLIAYFRKKLNF